VSEVLAVDFFQAKCQTGPHTVSEFGIRDEDGSVAYVDKDKQNEEAHWIATVKNPSQLAVTFTAIDGCVFPCSEGPKRCDVMLTTEKSLHLIELKDRKKKKEAAKDGKAQLISTIQALGADVVSQFKVRQAHVCNKRWPDYKSNVSERDFRALYKFVLLHKADVFITE
jgi:hypothetical protein